MPFTVEAVFPERACGVISLIFAFVVDAFE